MSDGPSVPREMPVRFEVLSTFSPDRSLQAGSKFSLAPIPAGIEYEEVSRPEGTMICYVIHTPFGVFRFLFPLDAAKYHHVKLGEILAKPRIQIATRLPQEPNGGRGSG